MRLEVLVVIGLTLGLAGLVGTGFAVARWSSAGFADLDPSQIIRVVMPSATVIAIGALAVFSSLVASLLSRNNDVAPALPTVTEADATFA